MSGHVSHKDVPGVEISTGSLGHGLSVGSGMAYAATKIINTKHVILGDGENDEGAIWEAALISNHFNLNNLVAIVDYNKMEFRLCWEYDFTSSLDEKWKSFGWNVINCNGHNHHELKKAFETAKSLNKPVIIANTVKGKGVHYGE